MTDAYPLPEPVAARIRSAVEDRRDTLVGISRALHDDPETAWQEVRSSALLASTLAGEGFDVHRGVAGLDTAFTATAGDPAPTTVAVVAEYDALPGLGHACGHNVIAAAAVGAALALRPLLAELSLGLRVVGAPAEEGGGGKIALLDAGVFDGLDAALMVHPGPEDRAWAFPLAVAHCTVRYTGTAAHAGAYPWLGVNAADAFTVAQTAIGLLRAHLPDGVRVHGVVTEAGTAPNAVPARATGTWYVRAATLDQLDTVFTRVRRCFEAGALATGCTLEIEETSGRYADFVNDEALLRTFAAHCARLGRDLRIGDTARVGMNTASTDMGNVSHRVPAIHPYLGIGSLPAVNHQREFARAAVGPAADRAIVAGATAMACTAAALARNRQESR
jgi:amidohydrolase